MPLCMLRDGLQAKKRLFENRVLRPVASRFISSRFSSCISCIDDDGLKGLTFIWIPSTWFSDPPSIYFVGLAISRMCRSAPSLRLVTETNRRILMRRNKRLSGSIKCSLWVEAARHHIISICTRTSSRPELGSHKSSQDPRWFFWKKRSKRVGR